MSKRASNTDSKEKKACDYNTSRYTYQNANANVSVTIFTSNINFMEESVTIFSVSLHFDRYTLTFFGVCIYKPVILIMCSSKLMFEVCACRGM